MPAFLAGFPMAEFSPRGPIIMAAVFFDIHSNAWLCNK